MEAYFDTTGQIKYREIGADTRLRYHEKYQVCCVRMTKWQWTVLVLLAFAWMGTLGYVYVYYHWISASHTEKMDQLMKAAEDNAIPGVPGWIAAVGLQYAGRQAGMDGYECEEGECAVGFGDWYSRHVDRIMRRYAPLYDDYGVRHPYETVNERKNANM